MILGIDIGGTKCAVVVGNESAEVIDKVRFDTSDLNTTLTSILATVDGLIERHGRPYAIGISCGGPLDEEAGLILSPPNLPDWDRVPICSILQERYGVPVALCNDANACALAEHRFGAGRGLDNIIFLTFGTGMGAGIVLDGRLYRGTCGAAGEIGHIAIEADGPVGYGKVGSLEGFCSGGGIARAAQAYGQKKLLAGSSAFGLSSPEEIARLDTAALAKMAQEGQADAKYIFDESARALGRGLAILIDTLNPEVIIIGSVYSRATELFEAKMLEVLRRECLPQSLAACKVLPSLLGERIGDVAALSVALSALTSCPTIDSYPHIDALLLRYPSLQNCAEPIKRAVDAIVGAYIGGAKLLLAGNGGSSADCQHISGELMKGFLLERHIDFENAQSIPSDIAPHLQAGIPAIPLPSLVGVNTAYANDACAEYVFAQDVFALGKKGDVLIGISTSGNSDNICHAMRVAKALGLITVALTGGDGGRLASLADITICAPEHETFRVQEYHLPIYHAICAQVEQSLFGSE